MSLKVYSGWWGSFSNMLMPPYCVLCNQPSEVDCLCNACKADLPFAHRPCYRCGLPLGSEKDRICGACMISKPPFHRTISPLAYSFPVDRMLQSFKFNRQLVHGRVLAQLLVESIQHTEGKMPDIIIPVPLHSIRLLMRGFNQSFELSSHCSRVLKIPQISSSLRRRRNTPAQSGLSRSERRRNLRHAFYWTGTDIRGLHIALVDDVLTTGSTVTECAKLLLRSGAARVDVWTAARAVPKH